MRSALRCRRTVRSGRREIPQLLVLPRAAEKALFPGLPPKEQIAPSRYPARGTAPRERSLTRAELPVARARREINWLASTVRRICSTLA